MRLIDADCLSKELRKSTELLNGNTLVPVNLLLTLIEKIPTAYDLEKVVEQLENERKFWEDSYDYQIGKEKSRSYEHAIELTKAGGID